MGGRADRGARTPIGGVSRISCEFKEYSDLVVIWASNGFRAKKMSDPDVPQDIKDYVMAILIIAVLTFLVQLCLVTYRCAKKPLTKMATVADF